MVLIAVHYYNVIIVSPMNIFVDRVGAEILRCTSLVEQCAAIAESHTAHGKLSHNAS